MGMMVMSGHRRLLASWSHTVSRKTFPGVMRDRRRVVSSSCCSVGAKVDIETICCRAGVAERGVSGGAAAGSATRVGIYEQQTQQSINIWAKGATQHQP